jgi:hypothetical protein
MSPFASAATKTLPPLALMLAFRPCGRIACWAGQAATRRRAGRLTMDGKLAIGMSADLQNFDLTLPSAHETQEIMIDVYRWLGDHTPATVNDRTLGSGGSPRTLATAARMTLPGPPDQTELP